MRHVSGKFCAVMAAQMTAAYRDTFSQRWFRWRGWQKSRFDSTPLQISLGLSVGKERPAERLRAWRHLIQPSEKDPFRILHLAVSARHINVMGTCQTIHAMQYPVLRRYNEERTATGVLRSGSVGKWHCCKLAPSQEARRLYPFTRHHFFNSDPTSLVHVILQQHTTRARLLKVALNHTWLDSIPVTPTIPFDSSHGFSDFHYSQRWRISSEETQVGTSALFRC